MEELCKVEEVALGDETIRWLAGEIRKAQKAFGSPIIGQEAPRVLADEEPPSNGKRSRSNPYLRQWAVSLLLAREAAKEPDVISFREEVLQGETLPHAEVERWLIERAENDRQPMMWLSVPVIPDPQGPFITRNPTDLADTFSAFTRWRVGYEGVIMSPIETRYIEYGVPGDPWRHIQQVAPGGVLERLWKLSKNLCFRYPWTEAQATMFVLTGLRPEARSVVGHVRLVPRLQAATRITLTVDPSVTPQDLSERYHRERTGLLPNRLRALSDKHLRLAAFIAQSDEDESWESKMKKWNNTYPETEYPGYRYDNRRNFSRDAAQVCQRLLYPNYQG
jgi:hypothetical protein